MIYVLLEQNKSIVLSKQKENVLSVLTAVPPLT